MKTGIALTPIEQSKIFYKDICKKCYYCCWDKKRCKPDFIKMTCSAYKAKTKTNQEKKQ